MVNIQKTTKKVLKSSGPDTKFPTNINANIALSTFCNIPNKIKTPIYLSLEGPFMLSYCHFCPPFYLLSVYTYVITFNTFTYQLLCSANFTNLTVLRLLFYLAIFKPFDDAILPHIYA